MPSFLARSAAMLAGLTLAAGSALAQAWPARPLTLVVPWPAGGPSDFVARQVQADVAKALGQPLVIDNVGGVGGALATHPKLKGFEFDSWAGIQVPRNTPDDIAQRLHKALYDAMQNPATRQAFE